ncbi:sensor histidine kinase [Methylorubrum extorquens]
MRLIVADDDPDTRALNIRALSQEMPGLDVVEVGSPDTLEHALGSTPDLLVTDYDLRWIDGFALFEMVKASHPNCHAIMVTGTGNEDLAVQAMKAGFDDYIVKGRNQLRRLALTARLVVERGRERRALSENRDLVLAELYHRLHNNLQIVISLIRQTEKSLQSPADRRRLSDLRQRIQVLSRLQEQFYQSPDFRRVEFSGFLRELASTLVALSPVPIRLDTQLGLVELPVDTAVPLGLLVNEIITNAVQHAFADARGGELKVQLQQEQSWIVLMVEDNGCGFGHDLRSAASGMGLHLVERLAKQIDGDVTIERRNPGTRCCLRVKL